MFEIKEHSSEGILGFLKPILTEARILGNFPFWSDSTVPPMLIFYSLCLSYVDFYYIWYQMQHFSINYNLRSYLQFLGSWVSGIGSLTLKIVSVYKIKLIFNVLRKLQKINQQGKPYLMVKYDNKSMKINLLIRYISIFFVIFCYLMQEGIRAFGPICMYCLITLVQFNYNDVFISLLHAISTNFDFLSVKSKVACSWGKKHKEKALSNVIQLHEELRTCCDLISEWYNIQLLVVTCTTFFKQLITSYSFLRRLFYCVRGGHCEDVWVECVSSLAWYFVRLYDICKLFLKCNSTKMKAKELTSKLSLLYVNSQAKSLNMNLLGLHFAMRPEVRFEACGFYVVDNTLLLSMISTTASYLIIILQTESLIVESASSASVENVSIS